MNRKCELLEEMLKILHAISKKVGESSDIVGVLKAFEKTNFAVYSIEGKELELLNEVEGFPKKVVFSTDKNDDAVSNVAKFMKIDPESVLEFVIWEPKFRLLFLRTLNHKYDAYYIRLAKTFFGTIKNMIKMGLAHD